MTDAVKTLIEENIDLIEENRWEEIYEKDESKFGGEFTEVMLEADIHPERYLKEIPKYFLFESRNISSFDIPDNIKSIGYAAFYNCINLTSVTIPNSVKSINEYAFYYCDNLTTIHFKGTAFQWSHIKKTKGWDEDSSISFIQCSDRKISNHN